MDILRFITAGNVDDGKSTLTGRLLYETDHIKKDILKSVTGSTDEDVNLALLADGLRTERQQGITIDVAYKYFCSSNRKYILTDAPGHFQFTKNLVTGASAADAIIVLIDAQNGITDQTKRHSLVAAFLKIENVIVAVNKMDAVGYDRQIFATIKKEYEDIAQKLSIENVSYVPISALVGDNVVTKSTNLPWYSGPTLIQLLEKCEPRSIADNRLRIIVQCILSRENGERWAFGNVIGKWVADTEYLIYPKNQQMRATKVNNDNSGIAFIVDNECERGDIISRPHDAPTIGTSFIAELCWLDSLADMDANKEYTLRIGCKEVCATVERVFGKTDIMSLGMVDADIIQVNEFALVQLSTKDLIAYDSFDSVPETGRGILLDRATNNTVAAFVIKGKQR